MGRVRVNQRRSNNVISTVITASAERRPFEDKVKEDRAGRGQQIPLCARVILSATMNEARSTSSTDVPEGKWSKRKIDSFRRWSSVSLKRSPRAKAKTSSLSCDPEEPWLPDGHRKTLRPIVDSVFGQGTIYTT
ncbi:unnamed protein product [Arctogadus glacialis]